MDDKRELIDGRLVMFTRNGLWQARIPLDDGRYLWRSLKTADERKATEAATRLFYQTETKLAEGLPVQLRTVISRISIGAECLFNAPLGTLDLFERGLQGSIDALDQLEALGSVGVVRKGDGLHAAI
jgi:hypothetical protein